VQTTLIGAGTLSNALFAAVTASRPAGADLATPASLRALIAAGICTLLGWTLFRVARPWKFYLRRVPGRPNHLNPLHVVGVFLVYFLSGAAAQSALAAAAGTKPAQEAASPGEVSIAAAIFSQIVLFGTAMAVASMSFRHGLRRGVGLSGRRYLWDSGRAVIGFFAVLPLCVAALYLTALIIKPTKHPMLDFLHRASAGWMALTVFSAVVMAPLAEELFFRGLVQSVLRRYFRSPWVGIVLGSGLFAASHQPQYQHMPALFVLGMVLGYNYERTGRLLAPVLLHAIFNAAMIWGELAG
jgi:membrane protease YdiL (CAAX protease family)